MAHTGGQAGGAEQEAPGAPTAEQGALGPQPGSSVGGDGPAARHGEGRGVPSPALAADGGTIS